jgi:hypothetical protein
VNDFDAFASKSNGRFPTLKLKAIVNSKHLFWVRTNAESERLERLARFYGVSIDQLLPRDSQRDDDGGTVADGAPRKLRIDVAKLSTMAGQHFEMLERFLRMIQVQRQDFNGKVITVRAHDTRAIAVMLDVPVDSVGDKLGELGLLFVPPAA